ncbi:MAG: hypothetical protein AAGG07_03200 [Planctomycetota bacterium]
MLTTPPLAISLAGLSGGTLPAALRDRIRWVTRSSRWIVLDGTDPDTRARNLDRSARRDLAATLRREELRLAGIDLFLPERHLAEPAHVDRASAALGNALELASDLASLVGDGSRPVVTFVSPEAPLVGVIDELCGRAERVGATLADGAVDGPRGGSAVGASLDPSALLLGGRDPAVRLSELGARCVQARLADAGSSGPVYVGSGSGRLDAGSYAAAVVTSGGALASAPVVLDGRGLRDADKAVTAGTAAWAGAFGDLAG